MTRQLLTSIRTALNFRSPSDGIGMPALVLVATACILGAVVIAATVSSSPHPSPLTIAASPPTNSPTPHLVGAQIDHHVTVDGNTRSWQTTWRFPGQNGTLVEFSQTTTPSPVVPALLSLYDASTGSSGTVAMVESNSPNGMRTQNSPNLLTVSSGCDDPTDSDHDGLSDEMEDYVIGTDSGIPDSDGDGYSDGQEVFFNTDPWDPSSHPSIPPHLIAWWPFDEGESNITADASGNLQTGVLDGDPASAWTTNGIAGNALYFDGSTTFVTAPASEQFCNLTTQLTVSAWIYPLDSDNDHANPIIRLNGDSDTCGWSIEFHGGTNLMLWVYFSDIDLSVGSPMGAVSTGQWSHVAGVFDGTSLQFYVNGVAAGAATAATGTITVCNSPVGIGHDLLLTDRWYHGGIDDLRVYNVALSQTDIQAIYQMDTDQDGLPNIAELETWHTDPNRADTDGDGYTDGQEVFFGSDPLDPNSQPAIPPNLAAWWQFDEGTGTLTADASGNGQLGTLVGSPTWTTNGLASNAIELNGVSQYITAPADRAFSTLTTQLTVSAWIYPLDSDNDHANPIVRYNGDSDTCGWSIEFHGGTNLMLWVYFSDIDLSVGSPMGTVSTGRWSHVAGVFDGTSLQFYVNGVAAGAATAATGTITVCNSPIGIGHDLLLTDRWYHGRIDELQVYGRALSTNEVSALYNLDSDGDGLSNISELNTYHTNPNSADTDGDGLPDGWEVAHGLNPNSTNGDDGASADLDGDHITNLQEYLYGTDPRTADTLDVQVNGGNKWATNQTVTVDTLGFPYPFLRVSSFPAMTNATVLANTGSPLSYTLPSTNNTTYYLYLQYADDNTNTLGPVLFKMLTLDTIPPVIQITSPTNTVDNQAFVHVQAIVYDPDPVYTNLTDQARRLKVWVNGAPYWNRYRSQIDIPRFPVVPYTNNVITIAAQDDAGNQSLASVTVYVDPSTDSTAPTFSVTGFTPNSIIDLPIVPNVWVSGQMDDLNAIMTGTVNGGSPITMNVKSNQFGYRVPVTSGTNTLVVRASDAAGNATSNIFTLVCGNRYQFAITSPAAGSFINHSNVTVTGYVSAMRDAGLPTQTNLVSVTVNGVGTTLGGVDGNSNRTFTTTNAIPVPIDGSTLTLSAVVEWADGTEDPTAEANPFCVTSQHCKTAYTHIELYAYDGPCPVPDYHPQYLEASRGEIALEFSYGDEVYSEWWQWAPPDATATTMPSADGCPWGLVSGFAEYGYEDQPTIWAVQSGDYHLVQTGPPDCDQIDDTEHYEGSEQINAPLDLAPDTMVLVTFHGVDYGGSGGWPDLSRVTFRGLSPVETNVGSASASFLTTLSAAETLSIDHDSFQGPGPISWDTPNGSAGTCGDDCSPTHRTGDWCGFGGGTGYPDITPVSMTLTVSPDSFTNCVGTIATFTASGAPDGASYTWSCGVGTLSTSGDHNETAQVTFTTPAAHAPVMAMAGSLAGVATGAVFEVQSLISSEGSNPYGLTNIVDWAESGVVTVTATPNPSVPPTDLPGCWSLTGSSDGLHVAIDKSVPGFHTIVASAGASAKTQVVVVVKCQFYAYERPQLGSGSTSFGHAWWRLDLQPAGATVLLAARQQPYVNHDTGYGCSTCTGGLVCGGPGEVWFDGQNGVNCQKYGVWTITLSRLRACANYTDRLFLDPGFYECLDNNCVTKTLEAAKNANIPYMCSCTFPSELAYYFTETCTGP